MTTLGGARMTTLKKRTHWYAPTRLATANWTNVIARMHRNSTKATALAEPRFHHLKPS